MDVNLSEQPLSLKRCGTCFGLVLREDWHGHIGWHESLGHPLALEWKES